MGTQVITRFWAGTKMPEEYKIFGQMWSEFNPNWHLMEWAEKHLDGLFAYYPGLREVALDLYKRDAGRRGIELYVQLADIAGYALVHRYGGIYTNCDMQPIQSIQNRLPQSYAWASYENTEDGRIVNAIIGAPDAGHEFWGDLIAGLPERYFANPTDEMVMTTGPGYLTDFVHARMAAGIIDFYVFPVEAFNPVHWKQIEPGGDALSWVPELIETSPNTLAVHHWGHKKDGRSNTVETATQHA